MPRSLSIAQVKEKNLIASDRAYIVCLHIEIRDLAQTGNPIIENIYLANNDEDITINGQLYSKFSFDITIKEEAGGQPGVTLTLEDITRTIQQRMQLYSGGVGSFVNILVFNEIDLNSPAEVAERFEVTSASSNAYQVSWQLGTQNLLAARFPNRTQMRDRCPWTYKDVETCAYTGPEPTCDYTLQGENGCAAKNNTPNFGGIPGIRSSGVRYA